MAKGKPRTLKDWMATKKLSDEAVATEIKISRVQVSRIRRGKNGASKQTAIRLEKLTGIPWAEFIQPERVP